MGSVVQTKSKLEEVLKELQTIQNDIGKSTNQQVSLNSHLTENNLVKQELAFLSEDANIFKLVGPVLIKQDLIEAKSNVDKRINFIKGEIKKMEDQTKTLNEKQEQKRKVMVELQQKLQVLTQQQQN